LTIYRDRNYAGIYSAFLCKIPDAKEVIVKDRDRQRRSRNDPAFEFPGKDKRRGNRNADDNETSANESFHILR
jgi:hypothetical protein